jgi:MFS family permease
MSSQTPSQVIHKATPKRAAVASFMGSAVEYYDFFIFGSAAALIFPRVFFPDAGASATVMSLATFGFAYIARPIGAVILGHFGDKFGRRNILVLTLVLMGASTFIVGCLPDFNTIGWAAPVLLVLCRLLQGLSAAGEQAGASSMSLEHAPDHRRAFFTSWTLTGTQLGQILATLVFIPVAALPEDILYSWGWRIPFWASLIVVVIALVIRTRLHEPPTFEETKEHHEEAKFPVAVLMKTNWRSVVRVICCALIAAVSTVFGVLAISFAKEVGQVDASIALWLVVAANAVALITQPLFGMLADRIGRKPVFIYGAVASAIMTFVYFAVIETGDVPLMFLTAIVFFAFGYAAANAVWPSFYAEMFHTRTRYSGLAIGTQVGFVLAGFMPSIVAALGGVTEGGWLNVGIITSIVCLVAAVSATTAKESHKTPTKLLGVK